jgi:hypothetical protein
LLDNHNFANPAFYANHTMGELDGLDDLQVSLPDLGGVSVDFANIEDYERLEQFNMLDLDNQLRD